MDVLRYNNENVYTNAKYTIMIADLARASPELVNIQTAYFFHKNGVEKMSKAPFDRRAVLAGQGGLIISVSKGSGYYTMPLQGLDIIVDFLCDTNILGKDLLALKGKLVTAYFHGEPLIGIGIKSSY